MQQRRCPGHFTQRFAGCYLASLTASKVAHGCLTERNCRDDDDEPIVHHSQSVLRPLDNVIGFAVGYIRPSSRRRARTRASVCLSIQLQHNYHCFRFQNSLYQRDYPDRIMFCHRPSGSPNRRPSTSPVRLSGVSSSAFGFNIELAVQGGLPRKRKRILGNRLKRTTFQHRAP